MAAVVTPELVLDDGVGDRRGRAGAVVATVVVAGALAGVVALGMWVADTLAAPVDAATEAPQTVIPVGQPPAVAATAAGRIVDTECTLAGPVAAVRDASGAYRVVAGGRQVTCPHDEFANGMTLRWAPGQGPG